ncbi:MAG TPA: diacylglycerol kinase family protein [Solirubrobacteraceae bacterium]|nr:diacylglycerol kinase family protein [Solirubrobacteraceae bacterium]
MRSVALLVNPSAGGGRAAALLPRAETALRAHGLEVATFPTRGLDHAGSLAARAAQAGDVVVTLGGDGLVGCVAGILRGRPGSVLGILPGGRGNDLARVLGIPRDLEQACAVIAHGTQRPLDVGEAHEDGEAPRTFVGIASVGFDSEANRIANEAPARLGNLVYAYGALRTLANWRPVRFELEIEGERSFAVGYSVAAANSGAYGGGMRLAPDARLDDGLLDVVVVEDVSRLRCLWTLPSVFRGSHVHQPNVHVLRAAEVRVDADRPFVVYADGDPIARTPVTLRAVPHALTVVVPGG